MSETMKVVLISPYEIGRQPFSLAQPAAWLKRDGFEVECIDLSIEPFDVTRIAGARLIAIHLAMHAGARLASEIIPSILALDSQPEICAYGLYAPVNDEYFRSLGCGYVFGGESESDILSLCRALRDGTSSDHSRKTRISMDKLAFMEPFRAGLPTLEQYSRLTLENGQEQTVGFVEASRGCKHLCRHCPIVPVYSGTFRVVSSDVVLSDIRQQIRAGAEHISFGDPDFLNGPGHARRVVERFRSEFPNTTWDATIKIEHILQHEKLLEDFSRNGCLFITTAVESVEDEVLEKLDKGHTAQDFKQALRLLRRLGITMIPTFVPFTPWTTLNGYRRLLREIVDLQLVNSVPPVQLSIRLLLPQGSHLLNADDVDAWLGEFKPKMLGYTWTHPDPRVDELQKAIQNWAMTVENQNLERQKAFKGIWSIAHQDVKTSMPELIQYPGRKVPQMSEPWYCCAEPTENQRLHTAAAQSAI